MWSTLALAVVAALVCAVPAAASPVLVLGSDGEVRVREDRFLPPPDPIASSPAARSRGPVARSSAKGPSVPGELRRLQRAGRLDAGTAAGYREAYDDARRTLRRLSGYRRVQLDAVLDNVEALAAARRFHPTRLPLAFLTLQRNRAWWAAKPIPAGGTRVAFAGSRLVWQHYPGQGLQVQWLGTFGKANGLFLSGRHDLELRELLDEARGLAATRAGGLAWESHFVFGGGRPPWVSGLTQGTALSALSRGAVRLKDPTLFETARAGLGIFRTRPPAGVRVRTAAGAHYLQYSYASSLRIANGFVQALNGLHDFAGLANDDEGRALFAAGEAQLREELPGYDTGAWSLYSSARVESDLGYHKLLRDFLRGLCDRLERRGAVPDPTLYCGLADRFSADLRTPPALALDTERALRAKKAGKLRFTLSKVSTVSLTVTRGGKVVLARTVRLGHGRHAVDLRPAQAGPLVVKVRAVDLAGNAAEASGEVSVRPAPGEPKE